MSRALFPDALLQRRLLFIAMRTEAAGVGAGEFRAEIENLGGVEDPKQDDDERGGSAVAGNPARVENAPRRVGMALAVMGIGFKPATRVPCRDERITLLRWRVGDEDVSRLSARILSRFAP